MHGTTVVRPWPLAAVRAAFIALAIAMVLAAPPAPAANPPPAPASETRIKVTPFPPSVRVDTGTADDLRAKEKLRTRLGAWAPEH
jgi:hypothetical protein